MLNKDSTMPLYKQLKEKIKNKIEKEDYELGNVIPTEQELCNMFAVSRHTVREAVSELVNEGLVEKIQGKGTVVISRQEVNNIKNTVGIIVPFLDESLISKIIVGVEKVINNSNLKLLFTHTDNDEKIQSKYIRQFRKDNVGGLIIFPVENETVDEEIKKLEKDGFPFVLIDRLIENVDSNYVIVNNIGGGYKAVDHLINLGHKKIGFISHVYWNTSTVRSRYQGYLRVLEEYHIPLKEEYVLKYDYTKIESIETKNKIKRYLTRDDRPTAVFCVNDYIAIDILNMAREIGLRVPEDLSVVGFDNNDILSRFNIPLTTINQPKEQIGKKAAEIILSQIQDGSKDFQQVVLPTKLIERESCSVI